jgi:pimeloyl-ACP methyl ester carboxylesterase
MEELNVPTLILWGEADQYLPVEQLSIFEDLMPGAKTQVFGKCGHALHEECAERVNRAISQFLFDTSTTKDTSLGVL